MNPSTRVERLLARMTLSEKLGQLQIVFRPRLSDAAQLVRDGIGSVFWPRSAASVNALQRVAVEETRLRIPVLVGLDVVHGQRTISPVPLAQAASFDEALVEQLAALAAAEARSGGVTWTFSPMVDVSADPRWGRVAEGFGEDPHLTSRLGAAMVRGYQGSALSEPTSIAATAKHFVAYGQPEGGRDYNGADVSERRLHATYLPPFHAAVDAGVASVMASFNTVAGRPMHAHRGLLTGTLKQEWGFAGVVVGDADGVRNLIPHGVAADSPDAVTISFDAGLDVEMGGLVSEVEAAVRSRLDHRRVDDAVTRVLMLKESLGLFDDPYVDAAAEITAPSAPARALARRAAARACVLLKNDGTLPLAPARRVLLTGPYAESTDHLGAWTQSFGAPAGRIADAFRARYPDSLVDVVPGTGFFDGDDADLAEASRAARAADLVVVLVGEPSALSGEAASRSDLRLPGRQEELIAAIAASGTPFVVVLENGRPLVVADWIDRAPTVVEAWHGGTEAAWAIVDVLSGDEEPAGRLPMSFPRSVGQIPIPYAHENTGRPATVRGRMELHSADIGLQGPDNVQEKYTSKYLDLDLGPQFAFGHGSGYTTFAYEGAQLSAGAISTAALAEGATVRLDIDVVNTGERDGDEVVQVYVRDVLASLAQPVRRLVAFERRAVARGERARFRFEIGADELALWMPGTGWIVEPGVFELHVGGALDRTTRVDLRVV
ncbi:glycoside hydrolase family 3 N-terminal domain-containing protein [Microbacterium hominis]|uniref:beta-glucosidase n=1 Tax=Microbacterium hominis TaxID=162426 RepID=A0A7D4QDQ9_9MICO|nr:glycoside hydrolase family 3 N-terminal domain-containing protein [Microbacterium hominis]QKJ20417.1 glycoside hydrolase family 3 C-terminal domain-containing protein [Microbacterium hominis]